jgi:Asp-tRNAAsn/Glu-tRNAGln amidotransferase A subunit and related amidases
VTFSDIPYPSCKSGIAGAQRASGRSFSRTSIRSPGESRALRAFLQVFDEAALDEAATLDAKGFDGRPLYGVPVAVKDNLCTRGIPTTCASKILAGYRPPYSATVVDRLRAAGP